MSQEGCGFANLEHVRSGDAKEILEDFAVDVELPGVKVVNDPQRLEVWQVPDLEGSIPPMSRVEMEYADVGVTVSLRTRLSAPPAGPGWLGLGDRLGLRSSVMKRTRERRDSRFRRRKASKGFHSRGSFNCSST